MYVLGPDGEDAGRDPRDDANAGSLVGKFVYENTAILFTGDAAGDAIGRMITRYGSFLRSDILKAPHHGGDIGGPAVVSKLEAAVSPSDVITSAGAPARREKAAGNYLTFGGAKEYYTYRDGALTVYIKPSGYDIKKSVENI
jgi:competence protein ComEC